MELTLDMKLDFKDLNNYYFTLLKEEDFNFKTKDINIEILQNEKNSPVFVKFKVNNILDLKIASNALIKSLEIINKVEKL